MDLARSGQTLRPFRSTPDTRLFCPTPTHDAALAGLREAFAAGEAVALLDGDTGLGKTVTVLKFLEDLDAGVPRLFLPSARFARPAELLQSVLFDADLPYQNLSEHELRLGVTDLLLKRLPAGATTVLVVDEAQTLSADLLEELRLLGNLGTHSARALFVVLVAWPALRERLAKPDYLPFGQRLGARFQLEALSEDESEEFLLTQLTRTGDRKRRLLDGEALSLAVAAGRGVPRLLNQLAATALAVAASAGAATADAEAMMAAMAQLGLVAEDGGDELPMGTVPFDPARSRPIDAPQLAVPAAESRSARAGKRRKAG